jgi:molybdenum cofactor biosynthesis protein B
MVDFQSRDSRPTYGGDEDEDEADEGEVDGEEAAEGDPDERAAARGAEAVEDTVSDEAVSGEVASGDEASDVEQRDEASRSVDEDPMAPPDEEVPGASLVAGTNGDESDEPVAELPGDGTATASDADAADTGEHPDRNPGSVDSAVETHAAGVTTGAATELGVAVVTVGDDVTVETDRAGTAAMDMIDANDYDVAIREVIAGEYDNVQQTLGGLVVRDDVDAIVTLGGDGVGPADVTVDAARTLFDKELPAFGELFRARAGESIGTRVLHTRTCAGIMDGVPVFCLPGSAEAAQLGLEEIVLPEIDALVDELRA